MWKWWLAARLRRGVNALRGLKVKALRRLVYGDWALPRVRLYRIECGVRYCLGFRLVYLVWKKYLKQAPA